MTRLPMMRHEARLLAALEDIDRRIDPNRPFSEQWQALEYIQDIAESAIADVKVQIALGSTYGTK